MGPQVKGRATPGRPGTDDRAVGPVLDPAPGAEPSTTSAAFIQVRGLTKRFGDAAAVDGLDLDVREGEFLVLLGPSGCGKSTTMRSIVGLEVPDAGSITVDGRVVYDRARGIDLPPNKRDMGMVFQSYALWPHKSVFGNVAFPLQMKRAARGEIRAAVADALASVGLTGFERRRVSTLSGGQMQRVALARSVAMKPKILLLDEPLSNLDARLRVSLRHELKEIQQETGLTSIYVTHDQDEALGLADRVVVMERGRIAQQGHPEDIFRRPATPFVAGFLGMANRYPVTVAATEGRYADVRLDGAPVSLRCLDARADASRADAMACLRPESLRILPVGSESGENVWPAKVLSRQYQGSTVRYHAALAGGPGVFLDVPAAAPRLDPGDDCSLCASPDDVLLLQDPDGAAGE